MTLSLSLNEVEATALKATRGAGHVWGLAAEAGRATRWLCVHGVDGCAQLAALLTADPRPGPLAGLSPPWRSETGVLCPLSAGAALVDTAAIRGRAPFELCDVHSPALLIPFLAGAAQIAGRSFELRCPAFTARCGPDGAELLYIPGFGSENLVQNAQFAPCDAEITDPVNRRTRAETDRATWEGLLSLAARTYAPATDESRRLGAGAGLNDND